MLEKYYFHRYNHTDLNVYRCGIEECKPNHTWGPGIRDHFIVHYIRKGTGFFSSRETTYRLGEGQGFIIFPDQLVTYTADIDQPWEYSWVGFHGLKAESLLKKSGFSRKQPVFLYQTDNKLSECLDNMIREARLDTPSELMLLGHLYIFLSLLIQNNRNRTAGISKTEKQEKYIRKVVDFISKNYSRKITIGEIASAIRLDRSYLYSIFQKYLNMSPQDFLIRYRIDRAVEIMKNPSLTIGDIARSVGYDDPLQFSKIFKKKMGMSPSLFRSKQ